MLELRLPSPGLALGLAGCVAWTGAAAQDAPGVDFYASLRTQVEAVSPDRGDRLDSYVGFRDAYSRVGVKIEHPLSAQLALTGQLELPVDSANFRMRDPYDQGDAKRPHGERIRLARLGVDHQVSDYFKVFAEYYREGETAVLTPRRGGLDDFDAGISGGQAIAVGLRYDF